MIAKPIDSELLGKCDLFVAHFPEAKIIEAQLRRKMRLIMAVEQRLGHGDVRPLGEAFTPPEVVFGNRVELRQIEGY